MMKLYDLKGAVKVSFLALSAAFVVAFLYFSASLVKDVAGMERARMQIWANATREIVNIGSADDGKSYEGDLEFLLGIIEDNRTIPVMLTDDDGNLLMHRNVELPEPQEPLSAMELSETNRRFLNAKIDRLRRTDHVIHISIAPGVEQHIYYEDSRMLRALNLYPYAMVAVGIVFALIFYFALRATKRAEQNKVWVGLSKETAHQLGTPISSLMAWLQLLEAQGVDPDIVHEMDKDVTRLSVIASRFSKIGSRPSMEPVDLNELATRAVDYMKPRISQRIALSITPAAVPLPVAASQPLLEWVLENLIKNAVDAMDGSGSIAVTLRRIRSLAVIEVTDSGKGMTRKQRRRIFNPGYTTKKRGWGLGLTLARRIISSYHGGKIFVAASEPGVGTTFRIELPIDERPTDHNSPSR